MALKKRYKFVLIAGIIWLLTLGIHFESWIRSDFSIQGGDAWSMFQDDTIQFYPHTWIGGGNHKSYGLPYLLHLATDVSPYNLSIVVTARTNRPYEEMEILAFDIEYDGGEKLRYEPPAKKRKGDFWFDDRGADRGETSYYRAGFSFPEIITKREAFTMTVNARYTAGGDPENYTQQIRVMPGRENYFGIGWYRLMLSGL